MCHHSEQFINNDNDIRRQCCYHTYMSDRLPTVTGKICTIAVCSEMCGVTEMGGVRSEE